MEKVKVISHPRGSGYTTWILESAICNPEVVIVSRDRDLSVKLHDQYRELANRKKVSQVAPIFCSLEQLMNHRDMGKPFKVPIIFDNCCFSDSSVGLIIRSETSIH